MQALQEISEVEMAQHTHIDSIEPVRFTPSTKIKTVYSVLIFIGIVALAVGFFQDRERTWHAYLLGLFYFVSLSLGGLFFTSLHHMTNAGWSTTIRRISESMTAFLPVGFILSLVLILGGKDLFMWFDSAKVAADSIILAKSSYLNPTFFSVRIIVFFTAWLIFAKLIVGRSVKQDITGDVGLSVKNVATSVGFILFFALSYSFFAVDFIMALDPHWFSTIFGVYCFSGLFQATFAFLILAVLYLKRQGLLKGLVTDEHIHDLAKLMKGFTVFWAYIAFSQFLLIWYANLPEETIFFYHRMHGNWILITVGLLVFRFIVPFLALLPRAAKRNHTHVAAVSILVLIMQFVDMFWLIYPNLDEHSVKLGFGEIGIFAGFAGLFLWRVVAFLSKHSVVPTHDPRLSEAINHQVIY